MTSTPAQYSGIQVRVCKLLAGSKKAVKQDGILQVSPAMYHLMRHASPAELDALVRSLEVLDLDADPVPLITAEHVQALIVIAGRSTGLPTVKSGGSR